MTSTASENFDLDDFINNLDSNDKEYNSQEVDLMIEKMEKLKNEVNIMNLGKCDYSDEPLEKIDINYKDKDGNNALSTIILSNCTLDVKKAMLKKLLDRGANPHEKLRLDRGETSSLIITPYELSQDYAPELLEIFDLKGMDLIPTQRFSFSNKKYVSEVKKELIKNLKKEGFPQREIKYRIKNLEQQISK